jgi:peptidoglycan/LPS O-acetylase OafA/YrhL
MPTKPVTASEPARHVPALDGWRGLAIVCLLIGHFLPVPGINFGQIGVRLFFVLSGMLMAKLLFIDRVSMGTFYRRRIARIAPAHLSFLLLTAAGCAAVGMPVVGPELLAAGFFFNNYVLSHVMPVGHIWSLAVEEHSYILLSLVALGARRRLCSPVTVLVSLSLLCVLLCLLYHAIYAGKDLAGLLLRTEVAGFGIAISALICVRFQGRGRPAPHALVIPLLLGAGIMLHWWKLPGSLSQVLGVSCFALAVNLLPTASAGLQRWFSHPLLCQLGLWSFSLYLWQQPFYMAFRHQGLALPLALAGALVCGVASYYLIEGPARHFLNARWGKPAQTLASRPPSYA